MAVPAFHTRAPIAAASDDVYARIRVATGLTTFAALAALGAIDVDLPAQQFLAVVTIGLLLLGAWVEPREGPVRIFVILLTVFTSTRYMIWRVTETIPLDDPVSLPFALGLFAAEFYGYLILILSVFIAADVVPRARRSIPLVAARCPRVDVLIPSYSEDPELLEITLRAAVNLRYPAGRLTVYLLDDGGTVAKRRQADPAKAAEAEARHQALRALCERVGARYLTRERNEHAKAGNINAALPQVYGNLVLILDADHVPTRDILERTVPYFLDDPKVFLVQTPHFFMNPDPVERNLDTFQRMPSENEMFYSVIQQGLDSLNGSFFCGSAAVLRRAALDEVGGIAGDTITEDAETALELHARGWRSVYVDQPMVAGLSPETFSGFIAQRMRWAQGMVQIFLLKNPLTRRGLSFGQRVCYLNSCFFWFFPYARLAFLVGPLSFLLFGFQIYDAEAAQFVAYAIPHVIGAILMSALFYGRTRWLFVSELYELVQSVHCAAAITKVFRAPRAPQFVVTRKGETLDSAFRTPLARPFYWLTAAVLLGEAAGIARWVMMPEQRDMVVVLLLWNTFHLLLLIGVLGVLYEQAQRRTMPRLPRRVPVALEVGGARLEGRTVDVSAFGVGLVCDGPLPEGVGPGDPITLDARRFGSRFVGFLPMTLKGARPRPDGRLTVGLGFDLDTPAQWQAAVTFCYARSAEWHAFRESRTEDSGQLRKLAFLMRQSAIHAFQHLRALAP